MACKKGCSACCELHAVCALEAHVIAAHCGKKSMARPAQKRRTRKWCVMLRRGECMIYPARPVICRTHGLVISLDRGSKACSSCYLNFSGRDTATMPASHVFDAAAITTNLMRLNMAFCMATGHAALASERFTMEQVLRGEVPESIL